MKKKFNLTFLFIFLLMVSFIFNLSITSLFAVVINTEKTAVVDIAQVFEEYYKTKEIRNDIEVKKVQLRDSLLFKQKAITELQNKYDVMSSSINKKNAINSLKLDVAQANLPKPSDVNMYIAVDNQTKTATNQADSNQVADGLKMYVAVVSSQTDVQPIAPALNMYVAVDTQTKTATNEADPNKTSDNMKMYIAVNPQSKSDNQKETISKEDQEKLKLKQDIEDAKKEIKDYEERTTRDIEDLEKSSLYNLNGEIYEKISLFARSEGYNVFFDKNGLVYSGENYDLTDSIIKEINKK